MAVVVQIPTPLREHTAGAADVSVPAGSVRQVLDAVVAAHPPLGAKLFDGGAVRPYCQRFRRGRGRARTWTSWTPS